VTCVQARRTRNGLLRALFCATVSVGIALAGQVTASAAPSSTEIEAQIDQAWNTLEPTIEQYNQVHSQLQANQAQAAALAEQLRPLEVQVNLAMSHVGDMAARAYKAGPVTALGAVINGGSPAGLAEKLTTLDQLARTQRAEISGVAQIRDKYAADKKSLDTVTATLQAQDTDLAAKKDQIEAKIAELQKMRVAAYGASGGSSGSLRTGPCPAVYTSDAGGKAAAKACSLIGKPYVWAAAGPGGYDCSGLTMAAWASVGVTLGHYTKWQWDQTKPVNRADAKPGDLSSITAISTMWGSSSATTRSSTRRTPVTASGWPRSTGCPSRDSADRAEPPNRPA
jgi:cell wall-associated NlpC family hydrolase